MLVTSLAMCRCTKGQLAADRAALQRLAAQATANADHVEAFFCEALLDTLSALLPDDSELTECEKAAIVMLQPEDTEPEVQLDAKEQFVEGLAQLVAAMADALTPVELTNSKCSESAPQTDTAKAAAFSSKKGKEAAGKHEDCDASPPRKSKQQVAKEQKAKAEQLSSTIQELLAVTSDMPEEDLPLSQAEIVAEAAFAGVVEHLVACLDIKRSDEIRQQAAGLVLRDLLPLC